MNKEKIQQNTLSYKTVFVQSIPNSCTNEHLKETFSTIGSIQEAFVVPPKDHEENMRKKQSLVGFVTYFSHDDAEKAVKSRPGFFVVDGRRLKVKFANKKKFSKDKRKKATESKNELVGRDSHEIEDEIANFGYEMVPIQHNFSDIKREKNKLNDKSNSDNEKSSKTVSDDFAPKVYTVSITGFPDHYSVKNFVDIWKSKGFALPEKFSLLSKQNGETIQQEAIVEMDKKQAALKVLTNLSGMIVENCTLTATLALDPDSKEFRKTVKRSRMIIRNLSFRCTEKDLRKIFGKYGKITEVNIPVKENKEKLGYAFVQLTHVFESIKAIKELNMTEIKGRKVAIDLCLPREQYQSILKSEQPKTDANIEDICNLHDEESEDSGNDCNMSDSNQETDGDDDNDDESFSDHSNNNYHDSEEAEKSYDSSSSDEDDGNNKDDEDNSIDGKKDANRKSHRLPSDVDEGKTVFLRNLSFDVTQDKLKSEMEVYGNFNYCLLVMNPDTGFSKGTAFVQFKSKEDAESCVKKIENESTKLVLDDRRVIASIAQTPGVLKKQLKEKKEEAKEKDKRNLYLASEGVVRPGTLAANGLSEIELKKRVRMEMAKRHKLKDPNVMVSNTRLCFHNLPGTVDNTQLRKICKDALNKVRGVKITECRVMRDLKNVKSSGVARSLGFAFINFSKHEHALLALRRLNNNPDIFSADKRPIIEFSLEDKRALDVKEERRQRQLSRNKEQKALTSLKAAANENGEEVVKRSVKRKMERIDKLRAMRRDKKGKSNDEAKPSTFKQTKVAVEKARQERQSFEGSSCITAGGKKAPMAKRVGPKIRNRNRAEVLERLRESKKLNKRKKWENVKQKRTDRQPAPSVEQKVVGFKSYQKQNKESRRRANKQSHGESFDNLVAKYAKKLKSSDGEVQERPKWFS